MKKKLLIDGDILIYKIATQNEEPIHWGSDFWTLHSDLKTCKELINLQIGELLHNLNASSYVVALTDSHNFRKDVLPTYKDNRKNKRKPIGLPHLRDFILEHHHGKIFKNLEADDTLGILATSPSKEHKIIVSIDKDLKQIPTLISDDGRNVEKVSLAQADYWFMLQTLTGDSVDGYPGLHGVGLKTAKKILGENVDVPIESLWKKVRHAYNKQGFSENDCLQQARVAKILRHNNYNQETGEINLWKM